MDELKNILDLENKFVSNLEDLNIYKTVIQEKKGLELPPFLQGEKGDWLIKLFNHINELKNFWKSKIIPDLKEVVKNPANLNLIFEDVTDLKLYYGKVVALLTKFLSWACEEVYDFFENLQENLQKNMEHGQCQFSVKSLGDIVVHFVNSFKNRLKESSKEFRKKGDEINAKITLEAFEKAEEVCQYLNEFHDVGKISDDKVNKKQSSQFEHRDTQPRFLSFREKQTF